MRTMIVVGLGVALLAGCRPPPPPPPPAAPPVEEPPPPPPPKCDALEEGCVANADTRSPIQASTWSIAPPPKWKFAHGTDATVARTDTASIAVLLYETGDRKTETGKRNAALDTVTKQIGLTMPKKKLVWPAKPAKVMPVEGQQLSLYQFAGATLDGKAGDLLVFTAKLPEKQSLLGVGFVLESDSSDADKAILTCIESLKHDTGGGSGAADAGAAAK